MPYFFNNYRYSTSPGIHYDPLYEPSPAGPVTVFPLHDSDIEAAAMLLAANAKKVSGRSRFLKFFTFSPRSGIILWDASCYIMYGLRAYKLNFRKKI